MICFCPHITRKAQPVKATVTNITHRSSTSGPPLRLASTPSIKLAASIPAGCRLLLRDTASLPTKFNNSKMLSQALKGAAFSSSSSSISVGLASSQFSNSTLLDSSCSPSLQDFRLHVSVDDDSLDTPKHPKEQAHEDGEEEEPFWNDPSGDPTASPFGGAGNQNSSIDALCRSFVTSSLSNRCDSCLRTCIAD